MPFPDDERDAMLALHGVGATVVGRLEQIGYHSLTGLRDADPDAVCAQIAAHMGATCWRNSPQARASIAAIVRLARESG
ncbi:helix-hairpin-helix domain-containing protein [Lysobacter maris]|uniref:Helix-hairpin-helix domain-containing protein n=1 Tax=Marilutibacter maris TaxID=1605891 RepID=A0A508AT17_9GAMM|nr:helix-hairpin-helix domain-containing protein [Lysobacter maris]KAB8192115.1 helix-hairpin-helix domain-containing protein [Lysobacter maris]